MQQHPYTDDRAQEQIRDAHTHTEADNVYVWDRTRQDVTHWVEASSPSHFQSLSVRCKLTWVRGRACCIALRTVTFDCLLCSAEHILPVPFRTENETHHAAKLDPLL